MLKVVVLGGGLQGITTIRSLKEASYDVTLISSKNDFARYAGGVSKFVQLPNNYKEIVDFLICYLKQTHHSVIIPMSDRFAQLLCENRKKIEIETNVKCAIPSKDAFNIASNKNKLMQFCKENNIPNPETLSLGDKTEDIQNQIQSFPFPALIKPNYSVGARGITKVYNVDELKQKLPEIESNYGKCHLQEFIDNNGPYYNVMIYRNNKGEIVNSVVIKIIRYYPLEAGSSCMCISIIDDLLVDICSKTLHKMNYTGFADFDVLQTKNGEYKIIEINPRVPASLRAAAVSGINFPNIIVEDILGLPITKYEYKSNKILRYLGLDILWFISSDKRFKSKPSWFMFLGNNIYYQEGGYKDFCASFMSFWSNFQRIGFKNGRFYKKSTI